LHFSEPPKKAQGTAEENSVLPYGHLRSESAQPKPSGARRTTAAATPDIHRTAAHKPFVLEPSRKPFGDNLLSEFLQVPLSYGRFHLREDTQYSFGEVTGLEPFPFRWQTQLRIRLATQPRTPYCGNASTVAG